MMCSYTMNSPRHIGTVSPGLKSDCRRFRTIGPNQRTKLQEGHWANFAADRNGLPTIPGRRCPFNADAARLDPPKAAGKKDVPLMATCFATGTVHANAMSLKKDARKF